MLDDDEDRSRVRRTAGCFAHFVTDHSGLFAEEEEERKKKQGILKPSVQHRLKIKDMKPRQASPRHCPDMPPPLKQALSKQLPQRRIRWKTMTNNRQEQERHRAQGKLHHRAQGEMWEERRPKLQERPNVKQQVIIQKTPELIKVKVQSW